MRRVQGRLDDCGQLAERGGATANGKLTDLTVLTFKWFDPHFRNNEFYVYDARYVNILRRMLERHLHAPHELVCVTDDAVGIDPGIRVVPMPPEVKAFGTYYPKLMAFHPDAATLFGPRILLMDLDVVIVRELDTLLARDEPFIAWETNKIPPDRKARFNTSFVLMDGGAFPQVWERFNGEKSLLEADAAGFERGDQGWVSYVLINQGASWPKFGAGIESFTPLGGRPPPESARVVFFNGRSSPAMGKCQAVDWVKENWR